MKKFILILTILAFGFGCKKNKLDTIEDVVGKYTWYSYTENGSTEIYNIKDYITITKDSIRIDTRTYAYDVLIIENKLLMSIKFSDMYTDIYEYKNNQLIVKKATYSNIYKKQ